MTRRKKPQPPIRPRFSDAAKEARGIKPSSFGQVMQELKWQHEREKQALQNRVSTLESGIRRALQDFYDGRRGDTLKTLRALLPQDPKPKTPPADPSAA